MKVLIVKTSALGDVVHAVPVVNYLHGAARGSTIDWLVEKPYAPLLEGQPQVRLVHRIDTRLWRRPERPFTACSGMRDVLRALRRERYDVVLDLQGNSKSGLFTFLCGAPLRYGFDRHAVREWPNLLATNRRVALAGSDYHITDRALRVAAAAFPGGCAGIGAAALTVDAAGLPRVGERMRELGLTAGKVVLLHPGTTWRTKCLSAGFWRRLAAALGKDGQLQLLLSWGTERELAELPGLRQAAGGRALVWPRGGIKELMALLAQVDVVIGGDTGPVHIAAALGTPTVSFYRVTDRLRNGPRGARHITLQSAMECSPCLRKSCPRNAECSDSIRVEEAVAAVYALLEAGPRGAGGFRPQRAGWVHAALQPDASCRPECVEKRHLFV